MGGGSRERNFRGGSIVDVSDIDLDPFRDDISPNLRSDLGRNIHERNSCPAHLDCGMQVVAKVSEAVEVDDCVEWSCRLNDGMEAEQNSSGIKGWTVEDSDPCTETDTLEN